MVDVQQIKYLHFARIRTVVTRYLFVGEGLDQGACDDDDQHVCLGDDRHRQVEGAAMSSAP